MPTYPKTKKYLIHLKMSKGDNYLHEHELYEMMRSRELYNVHKDLRKKLCRTIRGIEDAERVHIATLEAQRLLFVQRAARKVRERLKLTKVYPEDVLQLAGTNSENPEGDKGRERLKRTKVNPEDVLQLAGTNSENPEGEKGRERLKPTKVNTGDVLQLAGTNSENPEGDNLMRSERVNKHASGSYTFVQLPRFLDDVDLCDKAKERIVRKVNMSKNRGLHGMNILPHELVESRSRDAYLLPALKLQREQMWLETRRRNRDTLDNKYSPTLKSRFQNIRTARLENIRQYTQLLQGQIHDFNLG